VSNPQQKRVLVIDDDAMNREVMEAFLSIENYDVALAHDGQQGIQMAMQWQPDLIILDVRMPDMSGYEVCEYLKNQAATQHIPIVIATGFDAKEDRIRGQTVGADAFLTRPIDADRLIDLVGTFTSK
jgi:CheY-like chemotaxis protein